MNEPSPIKKINFSSIVGVLIGIGFIAVGIFNIVVSRTDAREYRNTTDIRTVDALVKQCKEIEREDSDKKKTVYAYELEIAFEVDGKSYTAKGMISDGHAAFQNNMRKGDIIPIEVYRTSKGQYKMAPENNPVDFLLACLMIPFGSIFFLALVYDLQKKNSKQRKDSTNPKHKKR